MSFILGTISGTSTTGITLTIDGETTPTTKKYTFCSAYLPNGGDRVLIAEVGDEYVVIDKIMLDRQQGGRVFYAQNAGSASSASSATSATSATVSHYVYNDQASSVSTRLSFRVYNNVLQYRVGNNGWINV